MVAKKMWKISYEKREDRYLVREMRKDYDEGGEERYPRKSIWKKWRGKLSVEWDEVRYLLEKVTKVILRRKGWM
jgi:hypothetical protein